jgi:hypothetical protein
MSEEEKRGHSDDATLGPQFKGPQQEDVSRALEGRGGVYLEEVQIAKA